MHAQVRGAGKKKHRWVIPTEEEELEHASKSGTWSKLSAVEQEKYIKMHNGEPCEKGNTGWHCGMAYALGLVMLCGKALLCSHS